MASPLIQSLNELVQEDLDGVAIVDDGLRAMANVRYGEVVVQIDHDGEAEALRVQVLIPPPAGAGPQFLVWCLATNTEYWDVKIGLDEAGMLAVHADLEAPEDRVDALMAADVVDRVDEILALLDEDLVEHLLETGLGTPAQRARWIARPPARSNDEDDEDESEGESEPPADDDEDEGGE